MPEDLSQIYACRSGSTARLRVAGRAVAHQCPAVHQFALQALDAGVREVLIELQDCNYGDSTFMGTLLQIRNAAQKRGDALSLVAPSQAFLESLQRMGLKRLFQVTEQAPPPPVKWKELETEPPGVRSKAFCENVVASHKLLADSSDTCKARYELIAEEAARELSRLPD